MILRTNFLHECDNVYVNNSMPQRLDVCIKDPFHLLYLIMKLGIFVEMSAFNYIIKEKV